MFLGSKLLSHKKLVSLKISKKKILNIIHRRLKRLSFIDFTLRCNWRKKKQQKDLSTEKIKKLSLIELRNKRQEKKEKTKIDNDVTINSWHIQIYVKELYN